MANPFLFRAIIVLVVLSVAVAAAVILHDRFSIRRHRASGLYPQEGEGTDADVKRLRDAGHLSLAERLYCELHRTDYETTVKRVKKL